MGGHAILHLFYVKHFIENFIMRSMSKLFGFPLFLVLYEISTYLSNDMYLPGLPNMMRDLHLSMAQAQLSLTIWFAGAAIMPLVMGMLSDRFGRRPILIYGGLLYIASTIVCAVTHQLDLLLVARFIEGAMVSTMAVAGYACIHESYDKIEAIKLLALMGSITILAPALGPLLGSLILLVADWRMIFWFIALFSLLNIINLIVLMPETLLPHQRVKLEPINLLKQYLGILTNRKFILFAGIEGCIFGGFIMWITASPILLIESFHYSATQYGVVQAGVFTANMLGNYTAKTIVEKYGVTKLIWLGLLTTSGAGLLMLLTIIMPHLIAWFVMAMTVYSFGSGLCFAALNRSMIEATDAPMGMRVALSSVALVSCATIGSIIVSLEFNGGLASLAYPIAIASFISISLSLLVHKRIPLGVKV